jgi:hypothetical protein
LQENAMAMARKRIEKGPITALLLPNVTVIVKKIAVTKLVAVIYLPSSLESFEKIKKGKQTLLKAIYNLSSISNEIFR